MRSNASLYGKSGVTAGPAPARPYTDGTNEGVCDDAGGAGVGDGGDGHVDGEDGSPAARVGEGVPWLFSMEMNTQVCGGGGVGVMKLSRFFFGRG